MNLIIQWRVKYYYTFLNENGLIQIDTPPFIVNTIALENKNKLYPHRKFK